MNVLELFSGSATFSKIAQERGHQARTLDFNPKFKPTYCMDIFDFTPRVLDGWKPDIVWASPDCSGFSLMTVARYWKNGLPTHPKAFRSIALAQKTKEIILQLNPRFWFIENPRAKLRAMPFMKNSPRTTVSYCKYGDTVQKPTDIWNNCFFVGRCCSPGAPCHERAHGEFGKPSKHRKGIVGRSNSFERAKIPAQLAREILQYCENLQ